MGGDLSVNQTLSKNGQAGSTEIKATEAAC